MTTKISKTSPSTPTPDPMPTPDGPVDWEKAFKALVALSCTGFVTSRQVEDWVQAIRDHVDPRAADVMVTVFNRTRSPFMQGFMG
jgi:hypothetical protein